MSQSLTIGKFIAHAIRDGEYGLFLGDTGERKSAWIRHNSHGIANAAMFAFGETHQKAVNALNAKLKKESLS